MNLRLKSRLFFTPLILLLLNVIQFSDSLRCYQCYSNSLEPCPYEDLRECPRFAFYNRCQVKVRKLITGETFVKRDCALGPCHGYDGEYGQNVQVRNRDGSTVPRLQEHCDTSAPEYECTACCRGDGCNYSSANGIRISIPIISTISIIGIYYSCARFFND